MWTLDDKCFISSDSCTGKLNLSTVSIVKTVCLLGCQQAVSLMKKCARTINDRIVHVSTSARKLAPKTSQHAVRTHMADAWSLVLMVRCSVLLLYMYVASSSCVCAWALADHDDFASATIACDKYNERRVAVAAAVPFLITLLESLISSAVFQQLLEAIYKYIISTVVAKSFGSTSTHPQNCT